MPRVSAASMAIVPALSRERPPPPNELTVEEGKTWTEIVERMPAGWFTRENYPVLVQYCRAIGRARVIAGLVRTARPGSQAFTKWLVREEKISALIGRLATRLRLTQSGSYDKRIKRRSEPHTQLWESELAEAASQPKKKLSKQEIEHKRDMEHKLWDS